MNHTVCVTGATGFVGRAVVRELLAAGHSVRALVRDAAKAHSVLPTDAKLALVTGNVLEPTTLGALTEGCDACIHLVGIIRQSGRATFQRVHVEATANMLEACTRAGIKRFIHMSAMGVRPDGRAEYQRTKFEGERLVRRSGLDWTVFRPGLIHGPDGEFVNMVRTMATGDVPPFFFIPYFTRMVEHDEGVIGARVSFEAARVAPVYVKDVAQMFAAALRSPASIGEVYNLSGPEEMDFRKLMETLRDELPGTDVNLPVVGLPGTPHAWAAAAAGFVGLGSLLPFDQGQAFMAQEDTTADTRKAQQHLGFKPAPFVPTLKTYAPAMATH